MTSKLMFNKQYPQISWCYTSFGGSLESAEHVSLHSFTTSQLENLIMQKHTQSTVEASGLVGIILSPFDQVRWHWPYFLRNQWITPIYAPF